MCVGGAGGGGGGGGGACTLHPLDSEINSSFPWTGELRAHSLPKVQQHKCRVL